MKDINHHLVLVALTFVKKLKNFKNLELQIQFNFLYPFMSNRGLWSIPLSCKLEAGQQQCLPSETKKWRLKIQRMESFSKTSPPSFKRTDFWSKIKVWKHRDNFNIKFYVFWGLIKFLKCSELKWDNDVFNPEKQKDVEIKTTKSGKLFKDVTS